MLIICDESVFLGQEAFGAIKGAQLHLLPPGGITAQSIVGADALIVRSTVPISAALLEKHTPSFIATATIGSDHVDLPLLSRRGVRFASAQGSSAATVAEFTWGLMALLAAKAERPLRSYSLGVVGCGAIGERVAQCGEDLGIKVVRVDPFLSEKAPDGPFLPMKSLSQCDLISLHVPLTLDGPHPTANMVNEAWLARLAPQTTLINTSRGGVVAEEALVQAYNDGIVKALALDVFPHEPSFDQDLIKSCTIATPHIAGRSLEGMIANTKAIEESFRDHFNLAPRLGFDVIKSTKPVELKADDGPAAFVQQAWSLSTLTEGLKQVANQNAATRSDVFKSLRRPPYRRDLTSLIGPSRGHETCQQFLQAILKIPR